MEKTNGIVSYFLYSYSCVNPSRRIHHMLLTVFVLYALTVMTYLFVCRFGMFSLLLCSILVYLVYRSPRNALLLILSDL